MGLERGREKRERRGSRERTDWCTDEIGRMVSK
jgi:hypothetical protein